MRSAAFHTMPTGLTRGLRMPIDIRFRLGAPHSAGIFCARWLTTLVGLTCLMSTVLAGELWGAATTDSAQTIRSGCEYDYPPYCVVAGDSTADGFSVELLGATLRAMGYGVSFKTGFWSDIKNGLSDGRFQVLPLVGRTPEREALFDFTVPYLRMHGAIVVRETDTTVSTLADLSGKSIAVMKGDNAEEFLRRSPVQATIQTTATFDDALRELAAGKHDAVVIQRLLALQLLDKMGLHGLRVVPTVLSAFEQDFCFAVRKGDEDFLSILNEGLSIVTADGTFNKLYVKWFLPIEALAQKRSRVVIGGDDNFPPYEFLDANGQPAGYNVDLTRAIAKQIGISVEVRLGPWAKIREGLSNGSIDAVHGMFYSAERDEAFDFSPPHTVISYAIVSKGSALNPDNQDIDGLLGKKIAVLRGDIMHEMALAHGYGAQLVLAESQEAALRMLANGECDIALVARVPAHYWIDKHGWKDLSVGSKAIFDGEYCYAALNQNAPLLRELSDGLQTVKSNGEYRRIYSKWLGVYEASKLDAWTIVRNSLVIVVPILLLLGISIAWSRMLDHRVKQRTMELRNEIAERKHAEDKVRRAFEKLDLATRAAHLGIWDWDIARNELIWDNRMYELYGIKRDTFAGAYEAWLAGIHPDDRASSDEVSQQAQQGKRPYDTEFRVVWPDGTVHNLKAYGIVAQDASGAPLRMTGVNYDITEQRRAEQEVLEITDRMQFSLSASHTGAWDLDLVDHTAFRTLEHDRIFGYNELLPEWTYEKFLSHVIAEDRTEVDRKFQQAIAGRGNWDFECRIVRTDGVQRWIWARGQHRQNAQGEYRRMAGIVQDITDRKQSESDRQTYELAAQQSQKLESLGILAGGIAHDFNNLMGGIFGYIDMAHGSSKDEAVARYLTKAMATIDRARGLTQQLLTFAKGGAPIKSVGRLFPFVQETARFALSGSNVSCRFSVPADLWPCSFDKNQIGQVIDNVVINAQQAMPRGGAIEISAVNLTMEEHGHPGLSAGRYVRVSAKDSGIGIPAEILPRIFDPFFTTKAMGHGLGLATCYSIVNRHGGAIDVESEPGKGSTFHVYLPASDETPASSAVGAVAKHRGSGTFLVMDDEEVMRDTVGAMLTSLGYTVVCKTNGGDAIDFFASETRAGRTIAGAILDLTIPGGMGGREAIVGIRKICPNTPVFVASGYADDPAMSSPAQYGFTTSICKPFTKAGLSGLLNRYSGA